MAVVACTHVAHFFQTFYNWLIDNELMLFGTRSCILYYSQPHTDTGNNYATTTIEQIL